jgi:hypothetical protein
MRKTMIAAVVWAGMVSLLCADGGLTGKGLEDWKKLTGNGSIAAVEVAGENVLQASGPVSLMTKEQLVVDVSKVYQISGRFRVAPGAEAGRFYLGIAPFDAEGRLISPQFVSVVAGSETQLAGEVKSGDTEILIKDNPKWRSDGNLTLAFDVDESGQLKDLPNRNAAPGIKSMEKQDNGTVKLLLNGKMNRSYPAGTWVRQHLYGSTYMYNVSTTAPAEWKTFTGTITGEVRQGAPGNKWWNGSKKGAIIVLANLGGNAQQVLQFKDITLEELSK